MNNFDFEIQENETSFNFPFRMFYNYGIMTQNHCHREIEFLYVETNSMKVYINGSYHTLNQGDVILISPGDIHGIEYSDHIRLVLQFKLEIIEGKYIENYDIYNIYEKLHTLERMSCNWPVETKNKVIEILKELNKNSEFNESVIPKNKIRILYLLHQLIYICLTEIPKGDNKHEVNHVIHNKKTMQTLEKVFVFIQENYNREISIRDVASLFHYSPEYFSRVWKKYIGVSFHKYLNRYRINKATSMLKETDLSVSEISFKTGFGSIKTFNRVFKSLIGISPSEYRKSNK